MINEHLEDNVAIGVSTPNSSAGSRRVPSRPVRAAFVSMYICTFAINCDGHVSDGGVDYAGGPELMDKLLGRWVAFKALPFYQSDLESTMLFKPDTQAVPSEGRHSHINSDPVPHVVARRKETTAGPFDRTTIRADEDYYYYEKSVPEANSSHAFSKEVLALPEKHYDYEKVVSEANKSRAFSRETSAQSEDYYDYEKVASGTSTTNNHVNFYGGKEPMVLQQARVNEILGYPIDDFQQRALAVIADPSHDLLAMAPTGSGKTVVALMAILQAFKRGLRAVYTSPVKALSNQKYAEFREWFGKHAPEFRAGVTLLTGDVQVHAPPGTKHELIICTSEILRDKVMKASGTQSTDVHTSAATHDADLERIGCVVSDEIHYISDPERGAVWEETLMHLPTNVQLVALSATLKDPEKFLKWIEFTRRRAALLVLRTDRHVPLHVGGLDRTKPGDPFLEFFGTHGQRSRYFDTGTFQKLFDLQSLMPPRRPKDVAAAQKARLSRDAELQAKYGKSVASRGDYSRKGSGGMASEPQLNFGEECQRLAIALKDADKVPAIVFCISRARCVKGARALRGCALLLGKNASPKPDIKVDGMAANIALKRSALQRQHLQRFMPDLGNLEAYHDIMSLLEEGIAYHHSGMLPVLREFVELCFQQRLVNIVFATESLALGVNMPARTVVFTQLDKPADRPDSEDMRCQNRWFRADEFWQMAGRAGRRGMDVLGYVVVAPQLCGTHRINVISAREMRQMLIGSVMPATSRLVIDCSFVLRHLARGHGAEVLEKTLLAQEIRRNVAVLEASVCDRKGVFGIDEAIVDQYDDLVARTKGVDVDDGDYGIEVAICQSKEQQRSLQKEMHDLGKKCAGGLEALKAASETRRAMQKRLKDMKCAKLALPNKWTDAVQWLVQEGYISVTDTWSNKVTLTPRGRASAAFADGHPLIMGAVIADGGLHGMEFSEICAWISIFLREIKISATDAFTHPLSEPTPQLANALASTDKVARHHGLVSFGRNNAILILDWCLYRDIRRIAAHLEPAFIGSFVKAVMRVMTYVGILRKVLLDLGQYDTHAQLDNYTDRLFSGVVTSESIYLHMEEYR